MKQGEERKADFINCVAWQQSAESISKFFRKGQRIALDGRLEVRTWEGNDGKTNYTAEVIVENWEFCQSKSETQQTTTQPTENATGGNFGGDIDGFVPVYDENLPF